MDESQQATPCPDCGAPRIEQPWPNGGDWRCGSSIVRIDREARRSWACEEIVSREQRIIAIIEGLIGPAVTDVGSLRNEAFADAIAAIKEHR